MGNKINHLKSRLKNNKLSTYCWTPKHKIPKKLIMFYNSSNFHDIFSGRERCRWYKDLKKVIAWVRNGGLLWILYFEKG